MTSAASHEYQVVLDAFRGPMDLLLYLVKREEVDVRDISVARVTEQFKEYLDVLALIDVERAGDFLVTAATLMEIKSKLLLPRAEESARRSWRTPSGRSAMPVLLASTWTRAPMPKHSTRVAATDGSERSRRTIQFP